MNEEGIGIIGFGRFGRVLHRLFSDGFDVRVSSSRCREGVVDGVRFDSIDGVVEGSRALFLTIPINRIAAVAERIKPLLSPGQVVVDVCSVKEVPNAVLTSALEGTGAIVWSTHPMFGPDSTKRGFEGLVWVTCEEGVPPLAIAPYKSHLRQKGLTLVETTCEKHDEMAARTQGLTHFIGRFLDELAIGPTEIDTLGYKRLMAVREQTCNDTWELFCDLQSLNRFSRRIQMDLSEAVFKVLSRFLDDVTPEGRTLVGVMRSEASAAVGAYREFLEQQPSPDPGPVFEAACFDSAMELLERLSVGELDAGVIAVFRADGGPAGMVFEAMGRHMFQPDGFIDVGGDQFAVVSRRRWLRGEQNPPAR